MKKIGILDDRASLLETTQILIEGHLAPDWTVVVVELLETPLKVVDWLIRNDVKVLVIDQNLTEEQHAVQIDYRGHQVVNAIRTHIPDLPVYMLTAFGKWPDVVSNKGKMEEVLGRTEFANEVEVHVQRMMRAGEAFDKRWKDALARLSDLSKRRATAKLTSGDEKELKALQTQFNLLDTRELQDDLLSDLDVEINKLAILKNRTEQLLKPKTGSK